MTVVVQQVVEGRRYSGWLDPRYPIGYWQAAKSLLGDASGGTLAIDLLFQTANGPERLNSQMYSVERFSTTGSTPSGRDMIIKAVNMGGPANQGFKQEYFVNTDGLVATNGSALLARDIVIVPWFLGSQRIAGTVASLSIIVANPDGVTIDFEAEGYVWSPRSVLVDGGPQRPPTGLYRA